MHPGIHVPKVRLGIHVPKVRPDIHVPKPFQITKVTLLSVSKHDSFVLTYYIQIVSEQLNIFYRL